MDFLDFEEWKKNNPDLVEEHSQKYECPHCSGERSCQCICGDTHTCNECDEGVYTPSRHEINSTLMVIYREQKIEDTRKYHIHMKREQ